MNSDRLLFKCMAIRPPARLLAKHLQPGYIWNPETDEPVSDFQQQMSGLTTKSELRDAAGDFVVNKGYHEKQPFPDSAYHFAEVHSVLVRLHAQSALDDDLASQIETLVRFNEEEFTAAKKNTYSRALWDHLIAFFYAADQLSTDPGIIVDALRVIHVWDHRTRITSKDKLPQYLLATPVMPDWALSSPASAPNDQGGDKPGKPNKPLLEVHEELLLDINNKRANYRKWGAAIADIRLSWRQQIDEAEQGGEQPVVGKGDADGADRVNRKRRAIDTRAKSRPWKVAEFFADRLQAESRTLLDENLSGWRQRKPDRLINQAVAKQTAIHNDLIRIGGRPAVAAINKPGNLTPEQAQIGGPIGGNAVIPTLPSGSPTQIGGFSKPYDGSTGKVHAGGLGDLLVIEDKLLRYEMGEVAHVENIMQSEHKNRIHRALDRTQESITTETSESAESTKDLETSDRYNLQREVSNTLSSDSSTDVGVSISASYGPAVSTDLNTQFSTSHSSESSETTASEYAQDVVERSSTRLTESSRTEITTRTLLENEERNEHGFDNTAGTGHVIGVYRWLNYVWEAQVYQYGKRALLEFIVPEPAAFYRNALDVAGSAALDGAEPPPPIDDLTPDDITRSSYADYVSLYQAQGVKAPPEDVVYVNKVLDFPENPSADLGDAIRNLSVAIPEGYQATLAYADHAILIMGGGGNPSVQVVVGDEQFSSPGSRGLNGEIGQLDIAALTFLVTQGVVTVDIRCSLLDETFEQWQNDTFAAILTGYQSLLDAYNSKQASADAAASVLADEIPPEKKREIEQAELKKSSLTLLTGQHFYDAGAHTVSTTGLPEILLGEANREGSYVQFFEQALEWDQMLYVFYDYFWGRKDHWNTNSLERDDDLTFEAFLKSGAARVQVPIRPGYEKALFNFLKSGVIWNGSSAPLVNDELYLAIIEELAAARDMQRGKSRPYGEAWTYTLPTDLIMLQEGSDLPDWSVSGN